MTDERNDRGQVGIGTLIVFIAMVLVAAIAAGVLINTAGFLQSKSQATGEESSRQVSDRLQEVSVTGEVGTSGAGSNQIGVVFVVVSQAPGADEIDLTNVTIDWIGPDGTFTLTHSSVSAADGDFSVNTIKDADSSSPVLNDPDDRLEIQIDIDSFTSNLEEGEDVTLKINTMSGATTSIRFTVPQSLDGKSAVEL